jgi:hypothetical protein
LDCSFTFFTAVVTASLPEPRGSEIADLRF